HRLPYDSKTGFLTIDLIVTGEDAAKNQKAINENGETSLTIIEEKGKPPAIYYRNGWDSKKTDVKTQEDFDQAKQLYKLATQAKTVLYQHTKMEFKDLLTKMSNALLDFGKANNFKID
ncbi:MAG: hypothetical protein K2X66_15140, partial [Cyanobacteria bacterium]|nr:hypothetical protein [Cyanobacteriota bacterium]